MFDALVVAIDEAWSVVDAGIGAVVVASSRKMAELTLACDAQDICVYV